MMRSGLALLSALLFFSPFSIAQAHYAAADAVDAEINEAVEFAEQSPYPDASELADHIWAR